jgi:hypothetical protein
MTIIIRRKTLCCGNLLRRINYECRQRKEFPRSYRCQKIQWYTLVSGEHWQKPTVSEIQLVRDSFPLLTDSWPAGCGRTHHPQWKSGQTGWCTPPGAVCAGWPDWGCRSITLSVAEDTLPDASEMKRHSIARFASRYVEGRHNWSNQVRPRYATTIVQMKWPMPIRKDYSKYCS